MRGLRSTIFLFVVLAGLGAYIYFVEWNRPRSSDATETKEKVYGIEGDKIAEVRVRAESGDTTVLKKSGTEWQMLEPAQTKGDMTTVEGITTNLGNMEIQRVIEDAATNLEQYGLAKPRVELTFRTADDKEPRRFLIGEKTSTGNEVYAMRADSKRVFLIPSYLDGTFNRSTFELRDKTILAFPRDKVDALELTSGGRRTVRAAKRDAEWRLTEPWNARADFGTIEGVIGRIETTPMKSIAAQDAKDLKKYGLAAPLASITVGAGSARATLQVGSAAEDGTFYARDESRPIIFTIDSSLVDELKKTPADFRRKDVFEFRPFNATRIELTRDGKAVAFEKTKATGTNTQDTWRQVTPEKRDADATDMDALLSRLSNLRAESFVDSVAPAQPPPLQVHVKYDDGKKEERVTLSRSGSDVLASRPDEPGAGKFAASSLDEVMKALDEVLTPPLPATPPAPTKP